jgi:4-alpha-glucanotransferase
MQDLLGLVDTYNPANPDDERINLPGTLSDFNWTYRLPVSMKTLLKDKVLISRISQLVEAHEK